MNSEKQSTGSAITPPAQRDTDAGTNSSTTGSALQRKDAEPLDPIMQRALSQLLTMQIAQEGSRGSSRFDRILKLVIWTEAAVQQHLEAEQRAILCDQLVAGDYPFPLIAAAAYSLASGTTKRYGKLDAETWRQAMLDGVKEMGQRNKAFQTGYNTGVELVFKQLRAGEYDDYLNQLGYHK